MRTPRVLAGVLLLGLSACGTTVPGGETQPFQYYVENRTHEGIEFTREGGGGSLDAAVDACSAQIIEDPALGTGATLVVDGETVWRFDALPPPQVGAMYVVVPEDGRVSVSTSEGVPISSTVNFCE